MSTSQSPLLSPKFNKALSFATEKHATQPRKGSDIPYISHLMSVSAIVLQYGGSEDQAIAGLLHDVIEDQGITRNEIKDKFNESVAAIVAGCSDTDVLPKPPWRERKEKYIKHLKTAHQDVIFVSIADKLDNARAILQDYRQIGEVLWSRFNGKKEGTLWYYPALVSAYPSGDHYDSRTHGPLLDELNSTVTTLENLVHSI